MGCSRKFVVTIVSIFLISLNSFAQESTDPSSNVTIQDKVCTSNCTKTQRNLDSILRRLEALEDKGQELIAKHELSLKDNELRYESSIETAYQRASDTDKRCKDSYQRSNIALDRCRDGLIDSLLGTGRCEEREDMIKSRLNMCIAKVNSTLDSTLSKNQSKYQSNHEKLKIKFNSRIESEKIKIERLRTRLAEAQAKHAACNQC